MTSDDVAGFAPNAPASNGLVMHPFRAVRYRADSDELGSLLCPPYDVIDPDQRASLLVVNPDNAVSVVLPETSDDTDPYRHASHVLDQWLTSGVTAVDDAPAIYVYEMQDDNGATTRGLLGAIELRDPADGVILPHENTMSGPVADRLQLMRATEANLEPIYLVYDGGGAASRVVREIDEHAPLATARTPDGLSHRLWAITSPSDLEAIAHDLRERKALIADGHHRYATYRQLQGELHTERGAGPWDRGLTLLVDSLSYGPQVHAIHRVLPRLGLATAVEGVAAHGAQLNEVSKDTALTQLTTASGFAAVLSDGQRFLVLTDPNGELRTLAQRPDQPESLSDLDVTVLHRGLVEQAWQLPDDESHVEYAHGVDEALHRARDTGGIAVLLRPTPVADVAAVAAGGARMPRKSTMFTPKPASGLVMRRFADEI